MSSFVGLMGPVGSGKSHGFGCAKLMAHANMQPVQKDGYRRSRYAIIRNTGPELKSTTIKTFTGVFPEGPHGRVIYSAPITYHMRFPPRGGASGLDIEIMFLALDNPQDVRKLLSLELTGAWVNEAREIHRAIVDALTGRIGRFPSVKDGGCYRPQIWADTNPPDDTNWWYEYFETPRPEVMFTMPDGSEVNLSYKLYKQPPAVLELRELSAGKFESIEPGYDYLYEKGEVIPAAGKFWGINPQAENLTNLIPSYYAQQISNKAEQYIRVYVQGRYGYVQTGKPVVPEFNELLQVLDIPVLKEVPLHIGIDIGGGTLAPAAIIGQSHPVTGTKLIHDELVAKEMGVNNFSKALVNMLHSRYPGHPVECVFTDPAAEQRDQIFETKVNEYLRSAGFIVRPAPTNDWKIRRQALADPCSRIIEGKPGLLVHPRCKMLISGLRGKWDFKKMAVTGADQYADRPNKNEYSHPCEAAGYLLLGLGEARPVANNMTTAQKKRWNGGWQARET
jgi:hypothetical protein